MPKYLSGLSSQQKWSSFQSGSEGKGGGWRNYQLRVMSLEVGPSPPVVLEKLLYSHKTPRTKTYSSCLPLLSPHPCISPLSSLPQSGIYFIRVEDQKESRWSHSNASLSSLGDERVQWTLTISHRKIPVSGLFLNKAISNPYYSEDKNLEFLTYPRSQWIP